MDQSIMEDIKKKQKFDNAVKKGVGVRVGSPYELNTYKNTPVKSSSIADKVKEGVKNAASAVVGAAGKAAKKVQEADKKMKKSDPYVRS